MIAACSLSWPIAMVLLGFMAMYCFFVWVGTR